MLQATTAGWPICTETATPQVDQLPLRRSADMALCSGRWGLWSASERERTLKDVATHDLPQLVRHILEHTGASRLLYVGQSQVLQQK